MTILIQRFLCPNLDRFVTKTEHSLINLKTINLREIDHSSQNKL